MGLLKEIDSPKRTDAIGCATSINQHTICVYIYLSLRWARQASTVGHSEKDQHAAKRRRIKNYATGNKQEAARQGQRPASRQFRGNAVMEGKGRMEEEDDKEGEEEVWGAD